MLLKRKQQDAAQGWRCFLETGLVKDVHPSLAAGRFSGL